MQAPASYTDDTHPALTAALVKPPFGEPYLAAYADDLSFFPDEPAPPHPALVAAVLAGVRPAKPGVAYDATLLPQAVRYWARRPLPTPENEGGPAAFPVSAAPPAAATNPPTRPETTPS